LKRPFAEIRAVALGLDQFDNLNPISPERAAKRQFLSHSELIALAERRRISV
jgi:hypothetical protein